MMPRTVDGRDLCASQTDPGFRKRRSLAGLFCQKDLKKIRKTLEIEPRLKEMILEKKEIIKTLVFKRSPWFCGPKRTERG